MIKIHRAILIILCGLFASTATAEEDWRHAIGTGFFALNLDGDLGLHTALGSVKADVDMDFDEIRELLESAFGFAGYSTNDQWTIKYQYAQLELEDSTSGALPSGIPASATLTFKASSGNLAAIYNISNMDGHRWGILGGVRYVDHEFDGRVTVGGTTVTRNLTEDWTDAVVGLTHSYKISNETAWNTQLDAGFGGSDGTYHVNTGIAWKFADSWSTNFYGDYIQHDYENGARGDADWYLYDLAEFGVGIGISYHF